MISNKKLPLLVAWREFWRKSRVGFLAWRDVRFTPGRESDRYFNLRQVTLYSLSGAKISLSGVT
jgi:hypothetical protein